MLAVRYYVYRGTDLAVTFEYGRRPVYHGALGRRVRALLAAPGGSLAAAGFHIVADEAARGPDSRQGGGERGETARRHGAQRS